MADDKAQGSGGFWSSIPGMMTALAALVTAVGGLVTVLKSSDKAPAASPEEPARTPPAKAEGGGQSGAPNAFAVTAATPSVAAPLPLGKPVEMTISVRYKLAMPQAVFGVYLEEFPPGDATCTGNVHHTGVGKLVQVTSQADTFRVMLKWQRQPGDTYRTGGPADHGYLSVGSNLWQDGTGRNGTLLHAFGASPSVCIPYG